MKRKLTTKSYRKSDFWVITRINAQDERTVCPIILKKQFFENFNCLRLIRIAQNYLHRQLLYYQYELPNSYKMNNKFDSRHENKLFVH